MKAAAAGLAVLLASCSSPAPLGGPAIEPAGRPRSPVSEAAVARAAPMAALGSPTQPIALPEVLAFPAVYRLVILEGHPALVREADPSPLPAQNSSLRLVSGGYGPGDLSYQPALLPQELAAELASNRQSTARMDRALEAVMARSRELSRQALELEEQGRKLAELLRESEAKVRQLEAAHAAPAQAAATDAADDKAPGP